MKFVNQKGKECKTLMSDEVMNRIGDIVEAGLKKQSVKYTRDGTKFNVRPKDISVLLENQMSASMQLISEGVITMDMVFNDLKANI